MEFQTKKGTEVLVKNLPSESFVIASDGDIKKKPSKHHTTSPKKTSPVKESGARLRIESFLAERPFRAKRRTQPYPARRVT